jgi:peptidylprolyl isomerase
MRSVERFIVLLLLMVAVAIPACAQKEVKMSDEKNVGNMTAATSITTTSGLVYTDLIAGSGPAPVPGKAVKVHYTGWLENGAKFDSSVDRNEPFVFTIGASQVIQGWDEGVMGMKVGGKRKLIIPAQLGYGSRGAGGVIPPGATLIFEVELLDVAK